jgi:hypothetical protein
MPTAPPDDPPAYQMISTGHHGYGPVAAGPNQPEKLPITQLPPQSGAGASPQLFMVNTPEGPRIVQQLQQQQIYVVDTATSNAPAPVTHTKHYAWHIALSCCVTWCLCWPFGLIAFILAICATVLSSDNTGKKHAKRLGIASLVLSSCGAAIGIIIWILFFSLR